MVLGRAFGGDGSRGKNVDRIIYIGEGGVECGGCVFVCSFRRSLHLCGGKGDVA